LTAEWFGGSIISASQHSDVAVVSSATAQITGRAASARRPGRRSSHITATARPRTDLPAAHRAKVWRSWCGVVWGKPACSTTLVSTLRSWGAVTRRPWWVSRNSVGRPVYTSKDYAQLCARLGVTQSMGALENPDIAVGINYGIAAVIWLVITAVVVGLVRRIP
jgi:transposase InsO family protein